MARRPLDVSSSSSRFATQRLGINRKAIAGGRSVVCPCWPVDSCNRLFTGSIRSKTRGFDGVAGCVGCTDFESKVCPITIDICQRPGNRDTNVLNACTCLICSRHSNRFTWVQTCQSRKLLLRENSNRKRIQTEGASMVRACRKLQCFKIEVRTHAADGADSDPT